MLMCKLFGFKFAFTWNFGSCELITRFVGDSRFVTGCVSGTVGGAAIATEETNIDASVNAIFFIKCPLRSIKAVFIILRMLSVEKET